MCVSAEQKLFAVMPLLLFLLSRTCEERVRNVENVTADTVVSERVWNLFVRTTEGVSLFFF